MRIPLLRTLSGRIVLGFTVLTITFAAVSALIVYNMERLSREIRIIRTGYIPLALKSQELDEKQEALWTYISDDLRDEIQANRAERQIFKHTSARSRALRDTEKVFDRLTEIDRPGHRRRIAAAANVIAQLRAEISAEARRYKIIRKTPPLQWYEDALNRDPDEPGDPSPISRNDYEIANKTLTALVESESAIRATIKSLVDNQSNQAMQTALTLERNERQLRKYSISLGLIAVVIGLLITVWATMTLRPLQRLREAAGRIAEGEYTSRIPEKGPDEVADLAREFNVMGRAIEERERELVRQERLVAVGKMAAMITHEVRNPLSAIGLNTELLEDDLGDSEEARSLCQAITKEVDRLTAITEEYLQFARLPKPKLGIEQVNAIARNLTDFQRDQMAQRGVELTCELTEELPPVLVDDAQIRQALLNLLRNATDAAADVDGGEVNLATRLVPGEAGDSVEISVSDNGPGIPDEIAPKLFDPFVSSKDNGTGLGLALTHQIIREHGGDIRVESNPSRGATFVISLPATQSPTTLI